MSAMPNQVATLDTRPSVVRRVAERYGVDPDKMLATLKATAFRGAGEVSNEQMMALLVVADAHGLNPWLKELYAFPSQQGIVPVVGVDGWAKLINSHPQFDGMDFEQDDVQCTCTIHRKDRAHPVRVTEYMAECKRPTGPWSSHPKRMLRHKALIQAARMAFSFAGIYDPDEAEAIVIAEAEEIDITPPKPKLQIDADGKPKFVNPDGSEYVKPERLGNKRLREVIEGLRKHSENGDGAELLKIRRTMNNDEWMHAVSELCSWEKAAVRKHLGPAEKADAGMQLDAWSISLLRECKTEADLTSAFKAIAEAYEANGASEVPETVVLVCDEMRMQMGAA